MFRSWLKQTRAAGSAALPSAIPASGSPSTMVRVCAPATSLLVGAEVNRSLSSSPPLAIFTFLSMHFIEGVPLIRSIVLFQLIYELCLATRGRKTGTDTRWWSAIPLLSHFRCQTKGGKKKITYSHSSNKKQLGKSVTQPKSIMLMKKIYKPRIMSLKTQASFRLKYKLSWKRNPSIQTDNPTCDNINTVLNM